MSGQCSLCLSCGAPFLPIGEDVVEYDSLGNISVFYFQKLVKNNEIIRRTVERPTFANKADASHVFHKAHHRHAVEYIAEKDARPDGLFPFLRSPAGKNPKPMLAQFTGPGDDSLCVDSKPLCDLIAPMVADGVEATDYNLVVACCNDCNTTMTMRFWFQFHLCVGSQRNPSCMIPDQSIEVYHADGNRKLERGNNWTQGALENRYPLAEFSGKHDVLTAALGYYLQFLCSAAYTRVLDAVGKEEHRKLYLHMCWVVLEVTCLLCEYWRGSGDAEQKPRQTKKRNRCCKSPLGAAELYFSYFCWRIAGFKHANLRALDFPAWHQFYMWYAGDCLALFPREEGEIRTRLIADRLSPDDMYAGSRDLVSAVLKNMTRVLNEHIMKLAQHVAGASLSTSLTRYFLPRKHLQDLRALMMR